MLVEILEWLGRFGPAGLCASVALLAFAETAIFADLLVPGEVGLAVVAAAGAQADVPLLALCSFAVAGAVVGDTVSYAIGRRWGANLMARRRRRRGAMDRAARILEEHGGLAVFLGRWVGVLRAVVPVVAGSAGMPFRTFLAWNVAASIAWGSTVVSLGYLGGPEAAEALDELGWINVAVVVGLVALVTITRWYRRPRRTGRATPPVDAAPSSVGHTCP